MNPVSFIFLILAPFLSVSPDNIETLKENAENWYEQSRLKQFFEKYWFIALILPVLYPIVTRFVQSLYDRIGDQDGDDDVDVADMLLALGEKLKKEKGE